MNGSEEDLLAPTVTALILVAFSLFHEPTRRMLESVVARTLLHTLPSPEKNKGEAPVVSQVCIYPVKSLRSVSISESKMDALGLVGDRRFMLVCPAPLPPYGTFLETDPTHRFITQRQCPMLARVDASISDSALNISFEKESVTIHLSGDPPSSNKKSSREGSYRARIWDDVVEVQDMGPKAADFFQGIVGDSLEYKGIRLVRIVSKRVAPDAYVPAAGRTWWGEPPRVGLSDGFPILIAFEASLQELNRRLLEKGKEPIPMSRFRPNIVIKNTKPFEEDTWKVIRIGSTIFHLVKGCPRCKQSCTDQRTGKVTDEPLETLADFRALGPQKADVYFAQNAIAQGTHVAVGEKVLVLNRGEPVWDQGPVAAE